MWALRYEVKKNLFLWQHIPNVCSTILKLSVKELQNDKLMSGSLCIPSEKDTLYNYCELLFYCMNESDLCMFCI